VRTPTEFYVARFLLGVAEAGFFPGIIVYFTHWFSSEDRGRALSGLVMAVPFSLAVGAAVSSLLLKLDWLGLRGWQWLFILEGLPAVVLGCVTLFYMTDRPGDARWLTKEEKSWLENRLTEEAQLKNSSGRLSLGQALRLRNVWLLALGIFATNTGGYAFAFWLPTAIKGFSGGSEDAVLLWSGLVFGCGLVSVFLSGRSSDRTGDRKWHCVSGQVFAALFLALSTIPGQPFGAVLFWLCLTGFAGFFWPTPFWALPTLTLTASAAAGSIGFINMWANLAGFLGNFQMGWLKQRGFGDGTCLLLLASCYFIGGLFVSAVRVPTGRR
jgi:ACS family tartrate transporter-like MFS transporter